MAHGMKTKKTRILEVLNKDPDLTNQQIAARFGITPSAASQYIHIWKKRKIEPMMKEDLQC